MVALIAISLATYTAVALLFKAAAPHTSPGGLVGVALSVVTLATAAIMLARGEWGGTWAGAALALLSGGLFSLGSICRVRALATTPVSLVFAITNLDLVLAGAVALFLPIFGQTLTIWSGLALGVAAAAILLGAQIRGVEQVAPVTFLALGILTISSLGFVAYARLFPSQLLFFILLNHLAGVLLNGRALASAGRSELAWGAALGVGMLVGFWALLEALAISGDSISLVLLALSMKTPLIALLAVPIFRERMTGAKLAAIAMASLAVILWEGGPALEERIGAVPLGPLVVVAALAAAGLAASAHLRARPGGAGWGLVGRLRPRIVVDVGCDARTGAPATIRVATRGQPVPVLMRLQYDARNQQVYAPESQVSPHEQLTSVTITLPTAQARELRVRVTSAAPAHEQVCAPLSLEVRGLTSTYVLDLRGAEREIVVPIDDSGNWCWLTMSPRGGRRASLLARAVGER